jgi:hypothetical protein
MRQEQNLDPLRVPDIQVRLRCYARTAASRTEAKGENRPEADIGFAAEVGHSDTAIPLVPISSVMNDAAVMPRRTPTDEDLLEELRVLLAVRGKLTMSLIEASSCTRSPNAYIRRFGSLTAAYARIGYQMNERQRAAATRFGKS